jgi:DNA helicase-2/ATP-dependent DNA helicase PcrA
MNSDTNFIVDDNTVDDHVDTEIQKIIKERKSFFMFAGAGSGKTRSLVNSLNYIDSELGIELRVKSKRVAVITYTNAACDEIMRRVGYNPLFAVSTIHSFLWELIKPYQRDIKSWIKTKIETDITELEEKQNNPRSRKNYMEDIGKKKAHLNNLDRISRFTYNPNGENVGRGSLNHSEVISMGASFIENYETMQRVLISKFPILLVDESQDTKKELVDALWKVNETHFSEMVIGMFGDTMQRIYMDGKENLSAIIPNEWAKPKKEMNHRSNKRIIQLANNIRATIDNQKQRPRSDKSEGFVRLFVVPNTAKKDAVEQNVYDQMKDITSDEKWSDESGRKVLVLEHSMAASRLGFVNLNTFLSKEFDQSFRDGTLSELSFLMNVVYQMVQAKQQRDDFSVMKILKQHSPLLKWDNFEKATNQKKYLHISIKKYLKLFHFGRPISSRFASMFIKN